MLTYLFTDFSGGYYEYKVMSDDIPDRFIFVGAFLTDSEKQNLISYFESFYIEKGDEAYFKSLENLREKDIL